jgi:elongin-A
MAIFIDQLPRSQLQEVEENCPVSDTLRVHRATSDGQHILKDTDWLWEGFLIKEFPLFYTKCREKGGLPRTSGWRRKFAVSMGADRGDGGYWVPR